MHIKIELTTRVFDNKTLKNLFVNKLNYITFIIKTLEPNILIDHYNLQVVYGYQYYYRYMYKV